jgi:hypothetical protein
MVNNKIEPSATIRPTIEAKGFLSYLKDQGIFNRMIDAYLFAAAYGIKNDLEITPLVGSKREDLVMFGIVEEDVRLAIEAGLQIIRKRNGFFDEIDGKEALELLSQYAEAGLRVLKDRWNGRVKGQIQADICRLLR